MLAADATRIVEPSTPGAMGIVVFVRFRFGVSVCAAYLRFLLFAA